MKGAIVYQVVAIKKDREKDSNFGTYGSYPEAEQQITKLKGTSWDWKKYHDEIVIRETVVDTDFEIPPLPKPRDRYITQTESVQNKPGTWNSTLVHVLKDGEEIASYTRNYSMLGTFEPFRQNNHEYALVAPDYTKTSVMDLETGKIIAEEKETWYKKPGEDPKFPDGLSGAGFCPVGFYVPDWWDIHDGSVIPGSPHWDADYEWPVGDFGFVWGCHWGDDSSWKVQYLDLSKISSGIVSRDDRFGYVELSTFGEPKDFIQVSGPDRVRFAVEVPFDLKTGLASKYTQDGINWGK